MTAEPELLPAIHKKKGQTVTRRMPRYTPEEVDRGLLELALAGGNSVTAAQRLRARGDKRITADNLRAWKTRTHPDRYHQVAADHAKKVEEVVVQQAREAAVQAGELEQDMLQQLAQNYQDLDAKDQAAAIRNITTSKAINVDKLLALTGRPSQITEHRNAADILNALQAHRIVDVVDSTAQEIPA